MKKIIITIMALITIMTLVSCKSESVTTISSYDGENYTVQTRTVDGEERVEIEMDGYDGLIEAYNDGLVSEEYMREVLFNSKSNNY